MRKPEPLPLLLELENLLISRRAETPSIDNPHLVTCWKKLGCAKKRCPAYGLEKARCWQIHGTFCDPKRSRRDISCKWKDCRECSIFRAATQTKQTRMTEAILNIRFALAGYRSSRKEMILASSVGLAASRHKLSSREAQVLSALLNRYGREQIAHELSVSPETVKTHVRNIYRKFNVHSRKKLAAAIVSLKVSGKRSHR
jgi:DNA-binding CsgD family transcriptional regulator